MKLEILLPPASSRRGHALVIAGSVCISFSALFVKGAAMDPSVIAFYRLFFGGAALTLLALLNRERLIPSLPVLGIMTLAAAFFCGDLLAWHACIVRLGPGLATILGNFQVFFLAVAGALFFREQLSWRHWLAIPLALAGLLLLLEIDPRRLPADVLAGLGFGLATALFYTGYILTLRNSQSRGEKLPAIANMAVISLLAAGMTGLFCQGLSLSFAIPDLYSGILLAALGILCQGAGWVLLSKGLPLLQASRAGLIMLTQPALAFIWDILFQGRPTGLIGALGAVVTILAIGLGLSRPGKPKASR